MREILFRGKQITKGEFIEGSLTVDCHGNCCIYHPLNVPIGGGFQYFDVDPETVGQYTGIDDREGEKIFEGDIFKIGAENNIYTVRFDYGCFLAYEDDVQVGILAELSTMFIKKIGNIHDNKELLS